MTEVNKERLLKIYSNLGIKEEEASRMAVEDLARGHSLLPEILLCRKMWQNLPLESSNESWINIEIEQSPPEIRIIFERILKSGISKPELTRLLKSRLLSFAYTFCYCLDDNALIDLGLEDEEGHWGLYSEENDRPVRRLSPGNLGMFDLDDEDSSGHLNPDRVKEVNDRSLEE